MRSRACIGLVLLAAAAGLGACGSSAAEDNESTVAASDDESATLAVNTFLEDVAAGDGTAACGSLTGEAQRELADYLTAALSPAGSECEAAIESLVGVLGPDELAEIGGAAVSVEIDGDRGSAEVGGTPIVTGDLELARFEDRWLIAAPVPLTPPGEPTQASRERDAVVEVPLISPDGQELGAADFDLREAERLKINLFVEGLPEPSAGEILVLWFILKPDKTGYPVSILTPSDGTVDDTFPVPKPVAVAVAGNAREITISHSPARALRQEIDNAVEGGAPVVSYLGDTVATGEIPLGD